VGPTSSHRVSTSLLCLSAIITTLTWRNRHPPNGKINLVWFYQFTEN
jgi:hypothetical protein